jgi:hypothetical protein
MKIINNQYRKPAYQNNGSISMAAGWHGSVIIKWRNEIAAAWQSSNIIYQRRGEMAIIINNGEKMAYQWRNQ